MQPVSSDTINPHQNLDRLMALRADVGQALANATLAWRMPYIAGETDETRAAAVHAKLWEELLIILVNSFDGTAEEIRAYARDTLEVFGKDVLS